MEENWQGANKAKDVYWLKKHVELVLNRLGIPIEREKMFAFISDNAYSIVSKKKYTLRIRLCHRSVTQFI